MVGLTCWSTWAWFASFLFCNLFSIYPQTTCFLTPVAPFNLVIIHLLLIFVTRCFVVVIRFPGYLPFTKNPQVISCKQLEAVAGDPVAGRDPLLALHRLRAQWLHLEPHIVGAASQTTRPMPCAAMPRPTPATDGRRAQSRSNHGRLDPLSGRA